VTVATASSVPVAVTMREQIDAISLASRPTKADGVGICTWEVEEADEFEETVEAKIDEEVAESEEVVEAEEVAEAVDEFEGTVEGGEPTSDEAGTTRDDDAADGAEPTDDEEEATTERVEASADGVTTLVAVTTTTGTVVTTLVAVTTTTGAGVTTVVSVTTTTGALVVVVGKMACRRDETTSGARLVNCRLTIGPTGVDCDLVLVNTLTESEVEVTVEVTVEVETTLSVVSGALLVRRLTTREAGAAAALSVACDALLVRAFAASEAAAEYIPGDRRYSPGIVTRTGSPVVVALSFSG
jgi:hypothetical protein